MMLAEEFDDISSEDEIEDDEHILSDDDGEIDEIVPALVISYEETGLIRKYWTNSRLVWHRRIKLKILRLIHSLIIRNGDFASIT